MLKVVLSLLIYDCKVKINQLRFGWKNIVNGGISEKSEVGFIDIVQKNQLKRGIVCQKKALEVFDIAKIEELTLTKYFLI